MYVYYFKKITTYTLLHGTRFDIELQGESVSTDILIFFFAQGEARWGEGGGLGGLAGLQLLLFESATWGASSRWVSAYFSGTSSSTQVKFQGVGLVFSLSSGFFGMACLLALLFLWSYLCGLSVGETNQLRDWQDAWMTLPVLTTMPKRNLYSQGRKVWRAFSLFSAWLLLCFNFDNIIVVPVSCAW